VKRTSASRPHRKFLVSAAAVACSAIALLAGAGVAAAQAAGTPAAASDGTWGTAREVAGALNTGGSAGVFSVSCKSAGNCSAGGAYQTRSGNQEAFVVNQKNGAWGTALEVAGRLNTLGIAQVNSVSCGSAGNCSAGGFYTNGPGPGHNEAFVVNERNGTWGTAKEVPGTAALNFGIAQVNSVSCKSAGNCSAGGSYSNKLGNAQPFVVSEVRGTWRTAQKVAGAIISARGDGQVRSVSCASAGNCSAGGFYTSRSGTVQAFVVTEVRGAWRAAREVAGALNPGAGGTVGSVSCASAGNCSAGGSTTGTSGQIQAFVVNEHNGTWGTARKIAIGGNAEVGSVSCAAAGNCSAGGFYTDRSPHFQAFVVNERNGTWGAARVVTGGAAQLNSVSCASAGNCSAGGSTASGQAFVVNERNGTWGAAQVVPGSAALNTGRNAQVDAVSCASPGRCSAGGYFIQKAGRRVQAFVVSET
jgi:hypothetical protein